jgi:hypothetical protein
MADNMLNFKKLLKGTEFKDKADSLHDYLTTVGVTTLEQVDNLPALGHIQGCDVYRLVAVIREEAAKDEATAKTKDLSASLEVRQKDDK